MSMSLVRRFVPDDIPRVAELHGRVFSGISHLRIEERQRYLRQVFFESPWYDDSLPSLVSEDGHDGIVGFLGVLPSRMSFDGRPIRVAISTQFMVEPGRRGLRGLQLLSAFLSGPQDLSMTDGATNAVLNVWKTLGGTVSLLYNIHWTRVLRPTRYIVSLVAKRAALAPAAAAARPFCTVLDAIATRMRWSPFHLRAPTPAEELTADELLGCFGELAPRAGLRPAYTLGSLKWLFAMAECKTCWGTLRKVLVRNSHGEIIGWYLYYVRHGGIGQVLQIAGRHDAVGEVLGHLFHHAWREGAIAVSGRLQPLFFDALANRHCLFHGDGPRMLIHSRHQQLINAIQCGDAFLTRLDGEWWMPFQDG